MRLTFVIYALGNGGAERVMTTMANYWVSLGWQVTILTFDDEIEPFYSLHPDVVVRSLGIAGTSFQLLERITNNVKRIVTLRRAIRESKAEVVISFMDKTNVVTVLATRVLGLPVIVAEHTDPAMFSPSAVWRMLRRLVYPRASRVVVLSRTAQRYFSMSIQRRTQVIPNPVMIPIADRQRRALDHGQPSRTLISVGRLYPEKAYDLLLRAFVMPASHHPTWSLAIWGDGPLLADLEALRDELGLCGRVHFCGSTTDPFAELAKADLFVMSSRVEGFPMALCEAMACGLPAVSFDCPSGPREIIRHGIDGILVPPADVAAMADALNCLMADAEKRQQLAQRAPDVLQRFGVEKVMGTWDSLIKEVTSA